MKRRLTQVFNPHTVVVAAVLAVSVYIGIGAALDKFHDSLILQYRVDAPDWERFTGILYQQFAPVVVAAVEIGYLIACLVLAPAKDSDRVALVRYARQQLMEPYLPESEQLFWSKVLTEVHHHD